MTDEELGQRLDHLETQLSAVVGELENLSAVAHYWKKMYDASHGMGQMDSHETSADGVSWLGKHEGGSSNGVRPEEGWDEASFEALLEAEAKKRAAKEVLDPQRRRHATVKRRGRRGR